MGARTGLSGAGCGESVRMGLSGAGLGEADDVDWAVLGFEVGFGKVLADNAEGE